MDYGALVALALVAAAASATVGFLLGGNRRGRVLEERLLLETGLRTAAEATSAQLVGLRAELAARDQELVALRAEARALGEARQELATQLEARERALAEQRTLLDTAQQRLADVFRALAAETLQANSRQFMDLAKTQFETLQQGARGDLEKRQAGFQQLVDPVRESLLKVEARIGEIEKERVGAYSQLLQQVESLSTGQAELRRETGNLVGALRRPSVRGRWGEVQLKRVVELAGMLDHVDFLEQQQVSTEDGDLRPDLVVSLPGGKSLVVDAKAPLEAYLESLELEDGAARNLKLADHARQIRDHIAKLSQKQYWSQFENTPDFVVLFIPGEVFYSAALEQDPGLIEAGIARRVILATPTTLIALLRTVAYGWRQESLAENARKIAALGKDLYERIQVMAGHWGSMGAGLRKALSAYNDAVGSLESRVLPAARRFRALDIGVDAKDIEAPEPLDQLPREMQAEEMRVAAPAALPGADRPELPAS
jgi:DNA recombination protein RmuC